MRHLIVKMTFWLLCLAVFVTLGCGRGELRIPDVGPATAEAPTGPEPVLSEEGP